MTTRLQDISDYAHSKKVPPQSLLKMAKLKLVIDQWMGENRIDATAIQCWDSMQQNYGINVCTLMSMMSERLFPSACETDISGALSMYALTLAANSPAALVDWNNNYESDLERCILFHCGNWARSLIPEAEIISAEILGSTLGSENTWGALQGRVPEGPLTFARIDTDDRRGCIQTYFGEGRFTNDPLSTISGSYAVVEVKSLQGLLQFICSHGFAHHCAVTRAIVAQILYEAFNNYLGWEVHYHGKPSS
jgi:L-fucose isomerase-like protein